MEQIRINTERYLLYAPDIHVGAGVKIDLRISSEQLQTALRAICCQHPLLTGVISIDGQNRAFYQLGKALEITPQFIESGNLNDDGVRLAENWMRDVNQRPFDLQKGPLLRILAVRDSQSTLIAAVGHHLLGDGLSYFYLLRDLLLALDNEADRVALNPAIIRDQNAFQRSARLGMIEKLLVLSFNRRYSKATRRYSVEDYHELFARMRAIRNSDRILIHLSEEETRQIIANCKAHGITVNDGISSAFLAARHHMGINSRNVGISISIRRELTPDPADSMGNFVGGIKITAEYNEDMGFWENAHAIRKQIWRKLNNPKKRVSALTFLDALSDELHDAINFYPLEEHPHPVFKQLEPILVGEKFKGLGISNLGKQDLHYQHFSATKLWFAPPLFGTSDLVVGVITSNQCMVFCLTYGQNEISKDHIMEIFVKAKMLLLDAT